MKMQQIKDTIIWIMLCLGMIISLISWLETLWPTLAALCGILGSGCRQAGNFILLGVPIPIWGLVYYSVLGILNRFARSWTFIFVMAGAGVETTLVWLMLSREFLCIFCMFNSLVMAVLLILFIRVRQIWQCIAIGLIAYLVSSSLLVLENPEARFAQTEITGASVVARVNEQTITMTDLESGIASRLYKMRREIYFLKLRHLEDLIKRILTQQIGKISEDREQGLASGSAGGEVDVRKAARKIMSDILHTQPLIDQYLEKPALPFTRISIGNSPSTGPIDAPVTVIEFSDYLCPACKREHTVSKEIRTLYEGKIRWIFMDYPLRSHRGADKLAEAARCAGEQGRFWEFQDLLFEAREHPDGIMLNRFAQLLKIDVDRFNQCRESGRYARDIMADKKKAYKAGVTVTPSFIINGRLNPGSLSLEDFKQAIDEALGQNLQ